ncbi:MAG TPA: SRPBCC family protein [Thermoplasmata archaeon]|nr:SRPBCC family protein [Thermoplasmata archaeon]
MIILDSMTFDVRIGRPPADVFAYLVQWERQWEWQVGVVETRFLTPARFGVGTTARKVRRTKSGEESLDVAIVAFDPAAWSWEDEVVSGSLRGSREKWRVEPDGPGSRVVADLAVRVSGFLSLAKESMRESVEQDMRAGLERLKRRLEGTSG